MGYLTVTVDEKQCSRCDTLKPADAFSKRAESPDGLAYICKACRAKMQRERRAANPDRNQTYMRNWYYQKHYGITLDDYNRMFAEQNGVCAICQESAEPKGRENGHLHVDHDHETGAVRGLLCTNCNQGVGHFKDDPNRMLAAAAYILAQEG